MVNIAHWLKKKLEESEVIAAVQECRGLLNSAQKNFRKLTGEEIRILESLGSRADSWEEILVSENFNPCLVKATAFSGPVYLALEAEGRHPGREGISLSFGIYSSRIENCFIGNRCTVENTAMLSGYCITEGTQIFNCGTVSFTPGSPCGNGISIPAGNEGGGRDVKMFTEMDLELAKILAMALPGDDAMDKYEKFLEVYRQDTAFQYGLLSKGVSLINTPKIKDIYAMGAVVIDGALLVENSSILGAPEEVTEISHGAFVKNSCIQWGSTVTSMAIVDTSLLMEHSGAKRHGKVTGSIAAPNTDIAEGEVTASFIGPFTGFHHQAMVIAAYWPEGRGNIGYGANVGSNHTSRAPDQELLCGEGLFFGLGTNIKYPANFSEAPYSVIATGVDTLPQKMSFPFSLIMKQDEHGREFSPAINRIIPAWGLRENLYAVLRNEKKYITRNKARRYKVDSLIFRPDIIDLLATSAEALKDAEGKMVYTDRDIPELGKNYCLEKDRTEGIIAYNDFIDFFLLKALKKRIETILPEKKIPSAEDIFKETNDTAWNYCLDLLIKRKDNAMPPVENMRRLLKLSEQVYYLAFSSRERDDIRGEKIIPDYGKRHTSAEKDPFLLSLRNETDRLIEDIGKIKSTWK